MGCVVITGTTVRGNCRDAQNADAIRCLYTEDTLLGLDNITVSTGTLDGLRLRIFQRRVFGCINADLCNFFDDLHYRDNVVLIYHSIPEC